ncbi:MAG: YgiT-type zinc finger protein [Roseivivax sp.]|nr:YgiT-type zinc finger protein [Roseivivax sp.]
MPAASISNINDHPERTCSRCGGQDLVDCETTTTLWSDGKPYVIERIPAMRCTACSEVLIDAETADTLKRIGDQLPKGTRTARKIEVPVISFPASVP